MIDLKNAENLMQEDIDSVKGWCNEKYQTIFASHFQRQKDLYTRLESKTRPITDAELEDILTSLPLEMFTAAEKLSQVKIAQEVIRLRNKQDLAEKKKLSKETTLTAKTEEAQLQMIEQVLLDTVYTAVVDRVDKEMSFTRELIMGAKKVWDRRRQTEGANPIGTPDIQAPAPAGNRTFYEQMQDSKNKQAVYGG